MCRHHPPTSSGLSLGCGGTHKRRTRSTRSPSAGRGGTPPVSGPAAASTAPTTWRCCSTWSSRHTTGVWASGPRCGRRRRTETCPSDVDLVAVSRLRPPQPRGWGFLSNTDARRPTDGSVEWAIVRGSTGRTLCRESCWKTQRFLDTRMRVVHRSRGFASPHSVRRNSTAGHEPPAPHPSCRGRSIIRPGLTPIPICATAGIPLPCPGDRPPGLVASFLHEGKP